MLASATPNTSSYKAGADLSAKQFHFVKVGTVAGTVVAVTSATDIPLGILQNAPVADEGADVAVLGGGAKLKLAGTVAAGGLIKTDSAGKGVAATTDGSRVSAFADSLGSSGVTGDVIPVYVTPPVQLSAAAQATNVAGLTGTLTGTANGSLADVVATAAACAGGAEPSATQVDTAIALAVSTIVTGVNEQLKEIQTTLNAEIAALKTAGVQASA